MWVFLSVFLDLQINDVNIHLNWWRQPSTIMLPFIEKANLTYGNRIGCCLYNARSFKSIPAAVPKTSQLKVTYIVISLWYGSYFLGGQSYLGSGPIRSPGALCWPMRGPGGGGWCWLRLGIGWADTGRGQAPGPDIWQWPPLSEISPRLDTEWAEHGDTET